MKMSVGFSVELACGHYGQRVDRDRYIEIRSAGSAYCAACDCDQPLSAVEQTRPLSGHRERGKERYDAPKYIRRASGLEMLEVGPNEVKWHCRSCDARKVWRGRCGSVSMAQAAFAVHEATAEHRAIDVIRLSGSSS